MLIRELVTRFGFDVDNAALGKLDASVNQITLALGAAGAAMVALPALFIRARKGTEQALGALTSVGVNDLDALEKRATAFSNKYAGVTKAAFLDAAYVTKSALSNLSDDAVGEFTALAAIAAKATKGELGSMIQTFGAAYESFKPLFKEMSDIDFAKELTAQISKTANIFNSDGVKISNSLKDIGSTATKAGVSMAEQFAVLGMLQANDPTGALSGTRYRSFIENAARAEERLNKGVSKGKRVSFLDPKTGYLKSALDIVKEIKKRFPDLKKAADSLDLKEAFASPEALAAIGTLIEKLPELEKNIALVAGASKNGTKEAEAMAEAMNRGMGSDLLKQKLQNLAEVMGKPIQKDADALAGKVGELVVWLQKLGEESPDTAKALSYLSFGMGGLFVFAASAVQGLAALALAMPLLKAAMAGVLAVTGLTAGSLALVALAVLAVVAAIGYLGYEVYKWVDGQKSSLDIAFGDWKTFKSTVIDVASMTVQGIKDAWSVLTGFFQGLFDGIAGIVSATFDKIAGTGAFATAFKESLKGALASAKGAAAGAGSSMMDVIARQTVPGASMASGTTSINAPVTVNMTVPQGTTAEQTSALESAAQAVFNPFKQILREAQADMAGASR